MDNIVPTYLDELLEYKRGDYGPLALFELDSTTWAVVPQNCLENEESCRRILLKDPHWFNSDWGTDGRRPNPTYESQHAALHEIIRLLAVDMANRVADASRRKLFLLYMANAEADLQVPLTDWEVSASFPRDVSVTCGIKLSNTGEVIARAPSEVRSAASTGTVMESSQAVAQKPFPADAPQAAEVNRRPWEDLSRGAKGLNLPMSPELYAKMVWCTDNIPKMSLQKLARMGAEKMADELIAKHYKE